MRLRAPVPALSALFPAISWRSIKQVSALFNSATPPALSHTEPALHCGISRRPIPGMLKRPVKTACCVACICQHDVSRAVSTLTTSNKLAAAAVRGGLSACSDGCCRSCRQYIHATATRRGSEGPPGLIDRRRGVGDARPAPLPRCASRRARGAETRITRRIEAPGRNPAGLRWAPRGGRVSAQRGEDRSPPTDRTNSPGKSDA